MEIYHAITTILVVYPSTSCLGQLICIIHAALCTL